MDKGSATLKYFDYWKSSKTDVVKSHPWSFNTSPRAGFELIILVVIGTDCTGSFKSNYHEILSSTAPPPNYNAVVYNIKAIDKGFVI
jgi:hypothetical protein